MMESGEILEFDGHWQIDKLPVAEVADRYGTPLFVYSETAIRRQYQRLRDVLPDAVQIYYSIKANPNPAVVHVLAELASGLEIASAGEYHIAAGAGIDSERILFAGPGKTDEELSYVLSRGLGELHVESVDEIDRIESLGLRANVAVRFNPSSAATGGAMRMGGKPSQFGIDEEQLPDAIERVGRSTLLTFSGIHMFAGTQLLDADVIGKQWRHAIGVARKIAERGTRLRTVDFGGGLGIPYFRGERALDLDALAAHARALFDDVRASDAFAGTRFIVEPGRFLVGPAGVYVARVVSVKESRGTTFVILDGGMNHHLAASGNLGQVIKKDYPIVNLSSAPDEPESECVVVGPLCTPLDTLGRKVSMPLPGQGGLVGILQSGAYALSASPTGFLSHRLPAEVLVRGGRARQIRTRPDFSAPLSQDV